MSRSKYLIAGFFLLAIGVLYFLFQDSLPPRTPRKIARNISGLNITGSYKVLDFKEEWNDFNGDGSLRMEVEIKDEQLEHLIAECTGKGYQTLPIKEPPRELDGALFLKGMEGFYKITIHDKAGTAFDLAIIDIKNKILRIYVFVS